jgi:hypothetical protein
MSETFVRIRFDPHELFHGIFKKYDFLVSLDGGVWAEGTIVLAEEHVFQVVYTPGPGLLRSDGTHFQLVSTHSGNSVKLVPA